MSDPVRLDYIVESLRPLAVPVGDLVSDPANARKHDEKNLAAIRGSLRVYGQRKPIVVNKRNGVVEAGNGTLASAIALGWSHIAAVFVDDDPMTAAGFSVSDNRAAELAEWDTDALDALLREVQTGDEDLAKMLADLAEEAGVVPPDVTPGQGGDEFDTTPEDGPTRCQKGDLWIIGGVHRLLCGDSTKAEDVQRVMGGEKAGLMNTDPPYGIAYANDDRPNPGVAKPRVAKPRVANDDLSDAKLQEFLELCFKSAVDHCLLPNAAWYLWHAHLTQGYFAAAAAAAAANVVLHRQIIWVKPVLLLGRGQYHWKHEPCFMGWVKGHQPPDYGLGAGERTQTTVWEVGGVSQADRREFNHSSPKPVDLFTVPIIKHLKPGEIAYEPFAGSGPQLVAAHRLGRKCYGIELEPKYCDVILKRAEAEGLSVEKSS